MTDARIARPFPTPPPEVRRALDHLRGADDIGLDPAGLTELHRPWDPAACPPGLRADLWPWLDDVAAWLNHTYAWQTAFAVPSCWPAHPHLVHELALLACLRVTATEAPTPHALEEWHRYALLGFTGRMGERLGIGCPPGRHTDWPARSWATEYDSSAAREARRALFGGDLHAELPTGRAPRTCEGSSGGSA